MQINLKKWMDKGIRRKVRPGKTEESGETKGAGKKKKRLSGKKRWILLAAAPVCAAAAVFTAAGMRSAGVSSSKAGTVRTGTVARRDITSELSSSGTISPKNTYDITSLVEGEVVLAEFEEGDYVEEGQILYQIDTSSMDSELNSANNSLARAQENYQSSLEEYNDALSAYGGNSYKATESGYVKNLYIKAGDKVGANTKIADIYDDKTMKIKLPFLSGEAVRIGVGNEAVLTLTDTMEQIPAVVTSVGSMDVTLTGGRIVRYVTLQVTNPGGLTTDMAATAAIGEFTCSMEGAFEPVVETVMSADLTSGVDVEALLVSEGDYIVKGQPVFRMDGKSADKLIKTYKDTLDKAQESMESAQNKLDNAQSTYDNYTITAPISGQVISKTVKAGDKVSKSSGAATTMAVIYDMSSYTFEMSVDELDVKNVQVGQSVKITADAVSGKTFSGTVANVSLQSNYANGVTNYPVTVTLDGGTDELLPGMNVDGRIILEEAENVLAIPSDALMRGNKAYVKDESVKESVDGVPAGFRSVEVETGLIGGDYVEIKNGLSEGEEVYINATSVSSDKWMDTGMPGGYQGGGGPMDGGGSGGRQGGGSVPPGAGQ